MGLLKSLRAFQWGCLFRGHDLVPRFNVKPPYDPHVYCRRCKAEWHHAL